MISIVIAMRSLWACKILNKDKKIEVRKGLALYNALKKAEEKGEEVEFLMYVTKAKPRLYGPDIDKCFHAVVGKGPISKELNGKVVARFTLREVERIEGVYDELYQEFEISDIHRLSIESCVDEDDLIDYLSNGKYNNNSNDMYGCALRISNLEIFDKPKTLADYGLKRAPESWGYTKEA